MEAPLSDCFMSYPGYTLGESYPSAEMQSVYSTAPVGWGRVTVNRQKLGADLGERLQRKKSEKLEHSPFCVSTYSTVMG